MDPQLLTTAKASDAPQPLCASTPCYKFTVKGAKSLDGASNDNAGDVYIGRSAAVGEQPIVLGPGLEKTFTAEQGRTDPAHWYFKVATDDDGVVVVISQ
jgi:hypothetical protein